MVQQILKVQVDYRAPKPDGSVQFSIDFRCLNELSMFNAFLMLRVDTLLVLVGGAHYLSMINDLLLADSNGTGHLGEHGLCHLLGAVPLSEIALWAP